MTMSIPLCLPSLASSNRRQSQLDPQRISFRFHHPLHSQGPFSLLSRAIRTISGDPVGLILVEFGTETGAGFAEETGGVGAAA